MKSDSILKKEINFFLIRGGFRTKTDALKAVKTMIDNHIYPKDSLGITESQYANEERVKQDFSTCQWFTGLIGLTDMTHW